MEISFETLQRVIVRHLVLVAKVISMTSSLLAFQNIGSQAVKVGGGEELRELLPLSFELSFARWCALASHPNNRFHPLASQNLISSITSAIRQKFESYDR